MDMQSDTGPVKLLSGSGWFPWGRGEGVRMRRVRRLGWLFPNLLHGLVFVFLIFKPCAHVTQKMGKGIILEPLSVDFRILGKT